MNHITPGEHTRPGWYGDRKLTPRALIAERKKHLRNFLGEVIEDLGFVISECGEASELDSALDTEQPDLLVLGVSIDGLEISTILQTLVQKEFHGKVLVIGQPDSLLVRAVRQIGDEYGMEMLPALATPFSATTLRVSVGSMLPAEPVLSPAVDVAGALKAGWLELWYQPKVHLRDLTPAGAEAMVRLRHPAWSVVPPASFIADEDDPHLNALSEFVIDRAIEDWRYLLERKRPVDLSINLPVAFLGNDAAVGEMCRRMPDHPAFGLLIEIESSEAIENLDLVLEVARKVRSHNIAISIDKVGTEWPSLMDLQSFPFVELKVDAQFITNAADDRLKQSVCRHIVEFAHDRGARVVAQGVDARPDYVAAQALGFDLVQGYLFGKPMRVRKFARARPLPTAGARQRT